jgi:hypothetical protein
MSRIFLAATCLFLGTGGLAFAQTTSTMGSGTNSNMSHDTMQPAEKNTANTPFCLKAASGLSHNNTSSGTMGSSSVGSGSMSPNNMAPRNTDSGAGTASGSSGTQ